MKRRTAKAHVKRAQDEAARRVEAAEGRAHENLMEWIRYAKADLRDKAAGEFAAALLDAVQEAAHYSQGGPGMRIHLPDGAPTTTTWSRNAIHDGEPVTVEVYPLQVLAVWYLVARRLGLPQPFTVPDGPGLLRVRPFPPHPLVSPEFVLKVR